MFKLTRQCHTFIQWKLILPPTEYENPHCFMSLPTLDIVRLLNFYQSGEYKFYLTMDNLYYTDY